MHRGFAAAIALALTVVISGCGKPEPAGLRIAFMANLTHAPALVARQTGMMEKEFGSLSITWLPFTSGPPIIEALMAGDVDIAYIGPNPALNGFVRSNGEALKIIAGACEGGSALVVRKEAGLKQPSDFKNRRVATPQIGNTQDIAARFWFLSQGINPQKPREKVTIVPVANPDILSLFQKKSLDAAWTVEPWVSRLETEADGVILFDEATLWDNGRYVTTCVIAGERILKSHPERIRQFLRAHEQTVQWINDHPQAARDAVDTQLTQLTRKPLPPTVLERAWGRLRFTASLNTAVVHEAARRATRLGFLPRRDIQWSDLFAGER